MSATETIAKFLVVRQFGGLYSGPGGWEQFQKDRPADAKRYQREAAELLDQLSMT